VGRQQRRDQVAGRHVAAHLDRRHPLSPGRVAVAGGAALHFVARRISAVDIRIAPTIVVAWRFKPCGVYCCLQLGLAPDCGFARGAVYRRVPGVDPALGGTATTDVGQREALRSGVARTGRRAGPVLASVANGKIGPARRILGAGREHLVGEFQPSNANFKRQLERSGSRGAHDVDVGDWADAVRAG